MKVISMADNEQPSIGKAAFEQRLQDDPKIQAVKAALDKLDKDPGKDFIITPNGVKEASGDTLVIPPSSGIVKSA